jgi:hypothetical protein
MTTIGYARTLTSVATRLRDGVRPKVVGGWRR